SGIIHGVPGPSGEPGVVLQVPPSEALDWDLSAEVASTARHWMAERQAWWVAAPYASTAAAIVARVHGPVPALGGAGTVEGRRGRRRLLSMIGARLRSLTAWLRARLRRRRATRQAGSH